MFSSHLRIVSYHCHFNNIRYRRSQATPVAEGSGKSYPRGCFSDTAVHTAVFASYT